jgi:hypothetical protein
LLLLEVLVRIWSRSRLLLLLCGNLCASSTALPT